MATAGQTVYPTPLQLRELGVWVQTANLVTGLDYIDADDAHDLLTGGIGPFEFTEESLREFYQLKDDKGINVRVAPIDATDCFDYEAWHFHVANLLHRTSANVYGPGPAHIHSDWVGSQGASSPTEGGEFTVAAIGDDPPKLHIDLASGYEQRLADIPAMDFPSGMPGVPTMYWTRRADAFRAYNMLPGAKTGTPYPVPLEATYCWLGWAWLRFYLSAPAASTLTVKVTSRRYAFSDNHLSDSTRQEDFEWMSIGDEEHLYRLPIAAGADHADLCLMTPLATEVEDTAWAPVGTYAFGRIDVYETVACEGECDEFCQHFWEAIFNAEFPENWWTMNVADMILHRPTGSSYHKANGDAPSPGDILGVGFVMPGNAGHAVILHSYDGNDILVANSNAGGDNLGYFSLAKYESPLKYRWFMEGIDVLSFVACGNAAFDGEYRRGADYDGYPTYTNADGKVFWRSSADDRWVFSNAAGDAIGQWFYMGPVGGDQFALPMELAALGVSVPPEANFMYLDEWFHWDRGIATPVHPAFERVVSIELIGFADGDWQLTGSPQLIPDPVVGGPCAVDVKSFEGHDPKYNFGGLSARVDCAHICTMYCGDGLSRNFKELTLPFFDKLIGATSGLDLTTAFTIPTICGLLQDTCDAWYAGEDTDSIEAHTKDDEDNKLSLWCFNICHPIYNGYTEPPLEQDPTSIGDKLNGALRAKTWTAVRGIEYMVIPDWVGEGRAQGLDLYKVGALARNRADIGQTWYKGDGVPWTKWGAPFDSDIYGLWRSGSLPMVQKYEWDADREEWYAVYWEWAVTAAVADDVKTENVFGTAPHRETVGHWIIYRPPGKGNIHIAYNHVAGTALVVDAGMVADVGVHKLQNPINSERPADGGLKWSERFAVEASGGLKWANIAIVPERAFHMLVMGDTDNTTLCIGLQLEQQGAEADRIVIEEQVGCPMAVGYNGENLLYMVARDEADGIAKFLRRDPSEDYTQINGEPMRSIAACDEDMAPGFAANPETWSLVAAVQANDAVALYLSSDQGQTWEAGTDGFPIRYPALWGTKDQVWLAGWSDEPLAGAEGRILLWRFKYAEDGVELDGDMVTVGAADEGRPGIMIYPDFWLPIIVGVKASIWDAAGPDLALVEYISTDSGASWSRRGFIAVGES